MSIGLAIESKVAVINFVSRITIEKELPPLVLSMKSGAAL
jgi:hypothetical protein